MVNARVLNETGFRMYECPRHGSYHNKSGFCPVCRGCTHIYKKLPGLRYCTKCLRQEKLPEKINLIKTIN